MRSLILGYGQIGKAVENLIHLDDETVVYDYKNGDTPETTGVDVLHVCFGYSKDFIKSVKDYVKLYRPAHIIIWSTVPIGTTKSIIGAVHSPVEGVHPHLAKSLETMVRWVGVNDNSEGLFFYTYFFHRLSISCRIVNDSDVTEALKLVSTAEYGINIVFADYKKQIADSLGMKYEYFKDWNKDYNQLYKKLKLDRNYQKFVLDFPRGKIGGHCVVPNAELLDDQFPDEMLKLIKAMK